MYALGSMEQWFCIPRNEKLILRIERLRGTASFGHLGRGASVSHTLVLGNKNYSSWSLRPWLAFAHHRIPYEEIVINIYDDATKQEILKHSPTGKVPVLLDGKVTVWESLAIIDYIAEKYPKLGLWPADPAARGHARAISAEMHAGFQNLRRDCPMTLKRVPRPIQMSDAAIVDIERIVTMWNETRARFGKGGNFLFGDFSAADCMYAPIATRIRTYAIPVDLVSSAYVDAIHTLPAFEAWRHAALKETWTSHYDHL
jgi:glutathione S-transferase